MLERYLSAALVCIATAACTGCDSDICTVSVTSAVVGTASAAAEISVETVTSAAADKADEEIAPDIADSGHITNVTYVRFSGVSPDDSDGYKRITVGDTLCGMTVDYIFSSFGGAVSAEHLMQTQVRFSGSVTLEGWLYCGRNEQLCFGSSELEENILYFIPALDSESDFPISPEADSRFVFSDGDISIDTDAEPIMLGIGDDIPDITQSADFSESSFVWAEVTLKDLQLRYGLDWFAIKYETCATAVDIKKAIQ